MQAEIRNSQWHEIGMHYEHGAPVTYVYRVGQSGSWEPWVVVAESAILRRLGVRGLGLYAGRPFAEGDYVGKYDGRVVGHYDTRHEALSAPETRRLLRRGHDKLVALRSRGAGFDLVDGQGGGPPHVERCNDPRGTALQPNTELSEYGWLRVTHVRVPAFSLAKTVEQNANAELRFSYGQDYWDVHALLGTDAAHAIEVE